MAKTTSSLEEEWILDVPAKLFIDHCSFSCDFGSSMTKVVCAVRSEDSVRLYFRSFQKTEDITEYIQTRVGDSLDRSRPIIVTGVRRATYDTAFQETLGVKLENVLEANVNVTGTSFFLQHCQPTDIMYEKSVTALEYGEKDAKQYQSIIKSIVAAGKCRTWKLLETEVESKDAASVEDDSKFVVQYPYLVVHLGSAADCFVIEEDGQFSLLDFTTFSGKSFLGLTSLLTNIKTFQEIEHLAEKGRAANLNINASEAIMAGIEDSSDAYGPFSDFIFEAHAFGKAIGKTADDFSNQDKAVAVLKLIADEKASTTLWQAMAYKVKQVVFVGGLIDGSSSFRDHLTGAMESKRQANPMGRKLDYFCLKYGVYIGAIGALLQNFRMA